MESHPVHLQASLGEDYHGYRPGSHRSSSGNQRPRPRPTYSANAPASQHMHYSSRPAPRRQRHGGMDYPWYYEDDDFRSSPGRERPGPSIATYAPTTATSGEDSFCQCHCGAINKCLSAAKDDECVQCLGDFGECLASCLNPINCCKVCCAILADGKCSSD